MLPGMAMHRPNTQAHACVEQQALWQVAPLRFAGTSLGSSYDLTLPCGGVVAHPPGSGDLDAQVGILLRETFAARLLLACPQGKTRIVAALAARDNDREALEGPSMARTWKEIGPCGTRCALRSGLRLRESPSGPADPGRLMISHLT